jgi:L-ribulose-5-phosphate 3-epimerase
VIQSCVFTDELSEDFEEAIRICAELRVPYIEPRLGLYGSNVNQIDLDVAKRMKKYMDRYGVKVGCIGSKFGKCSLSDEDEWREHLGILERQIALAALWDVHLLRVFAFWVPKDIDPRSDRRPDLEAYLPQIVDRLQGPCARDEREGLALTMETEGWTFGGTCPEVRAIIDAVGSPALTCCWDVANSWHYGRVAWPDDYPLIKGMVSHLHIKDAVYDPKDRSKRIASTYIDRGEIPWPDILRTLAADGYSGLASLETHLFFELADFYQWLQPATISALRNLNRVLAEVQGVI